MRLQPNCSELIIKLPEEMSREDIKKRLTAIGIEEKTIKGFWNWEPQTGEKLLVDKDNSCTPDIEHHSTIRLSKYDDDTAYSIVGHQHCQWQIFPTFKKISKEFNAKVKSGDGGSTDSYEKWYNKYQDYVKTLTEGSMTKVTKLLQEHGYWLKGVIEQLQFSKEREKLIKKALVVNRLTEK